MASVWGLDGTPVPGVAVTFAAPNSGASATLTNAVTVTNKNGLASTNATANTVAGSYSVGASVQALNVIQTSYALTNTAASANSITATGGGSQQTTVNTPFATALQATVRDAFGNPVAGVTVTFTAGSATSGASATLSSATAQTDVGGTASVNATANGAAGTYTVVATTQGSTGSATFPLTNTTGTGAVTVLSSGSPSRFGSTVRLTATVSPAAATGFVAYYDGANLLGASPLANGVSLFATSLLSSGNHSITAHYSGDSNYNAANSPALPQTVNATPATLFLSGATVNVGKTPVAITATDFNGDGVADLAVVNSADNTVSILLGNGDGTVTAQANLSFTSSVAGLVAGDFNHDGNVDLAVATGSSVNIFLGNGDGTFRAANTYTVVGVPVAIAAGDFNSDGYFDLLVASTYQGGYISLLNGNGDGTFAQSETAALLIPANPTAIAAGDFNGDGHPDFAVTAANGNVYVAIWTGPGSFGRPIVNAAGASPQSIVVADLNSDGKLDLVTANVGSNPANVSVLLGNGDGTFAAAKNYPTGGSAAAGVVIGDTNGDGIPDVIAANMSSQSVAVLAGNGDGTFAAPVSYQVGTLPDALAVADFNGDGRTDVVAANGGSATLSFLLGAGPAAAITVSAGGTQFAIVNTAFATALQATVTDSAGAVLPNVSVTFTAPGTGASGTFAGGGTTATVQTNATGIATAPVFTANGIAGSYTVTGTIAGVTNPATFSLTNTALGALTITTSALPGGVIGTAYSASVSVVSGTSPYAWSLVPGSGSLPAGLTLNTSTGAISGTPTGPAATATFTIQVTDGSSPTPQTVSRQFTIVINGSTPSPLSITTANLPNALFNSPYAATVAAQGGVTPYAWSIVAGSGSLPAGLTLNASTGIISGAPTGVGTSRFTVLVRDSSGQTATAALSIVVNQVAITITFPGGTQQQPGATVSNGQITLAQPLSTDLTGSLSLSFNENAAALPPQYVNPGVCFSSTSCSTPPQTTASFTIPAGSTTATIPAIQTGTVAGDIVVSVTVSCPSTATCPTSTSTLTVPRRAPIIEANSVQILDLTSSGFVVELVASSTPRDVQTATFTFNAAPGAQINGTNTFNVNVSSLLSQWYSSTQGQTYGSAFSLQVPFTLSGSASAIQSVTVTLTNSVGTSSAVTGTP
jgi:hypothetical protein